MTKAAENDFEFLISELGREWSLSKRTKKILEMSKEEIAVVGNWLENQIKLMNEAREDETLTFKCFIKITRKANINLRIIKKLVGLKPDAEGMICLPLDAEEYAVVQEILPK
ncbi:MAG: hypothetical protein ACI4E1_02860 [Lachnospira sp.]